MITLKKYRCALRGVWLTVSLPSDAVIREFANQAQTINCYAETEGSPVMSDHTFLCAGAPVDVTTAGTPRGSIQKNGRLFIYGD